MQKYLLFGLCIILLSSCYKEDEEKVYADVEGVVLSNSAPVEGAEIHIKSFFQPGGFTQGEVTNNGIQIEFNAFTHGKYRIDLFRLGGEEPFATIMEDSLSEGVYSYNVADSLLTNGVYIYRIFTPLSQPAQSNFLINRPDSTLHTVLPLTVTDSEGSFHVDADYLAIDETFYRGNEQFRIGDSLQVIVVMDDEIVARERIQVKEIVSFVEINVE